MWQIKDSGVLKSVSIIGCMAVLVSLPGWASAQERKMTLGAVQSSIREGMDQASVAVALGSPNIVTTDASGNETWIYDKISTETSHSSSSQLQANSDSKSAAAGVGGMIGAGIIGVLGGATASRSSNAFNSTDEHSGTQSQTQRTLTVVIKFDDDKLVSKVRYNQSAF